MPITINIKDKKIVKKELPVILRSLILSGTKSNIDTVIITPAAKLKELAIILSLFLNLIKINIVPNRVEKPAKVVNKKAK